MADFQFSLINFEVEQIQVIAGSADPIEKTKKLADELRITYPIAYGLDFEGISGIIGAFYEAERKFLNPTNILLRPDRTRTPSRAVPRRTAP